LIRSFYRAFAVALVLMLLNGCTAQSDSGQTQVQGTSTISAGAAF
jgi:hypothetical protein